MRTGGVRGGEEQRKDLEAVMEETLIWEPLCTGLRDVKCPPGEAKRTLPFRDPGTWRSESSELLSRVWLRLYPGCRLQY